MDMKMDSEDGKSPRAYHAQKKILCVLEKIKEGWDLLPEDRDLRKHSSTFYQLVKECGLDNFYQLEDILAILKQDGLITRYEIDNEAR